MKNMFYIQRSDRRTALLFFLVVALMAVGMAVVGNRDKEEVAVENAADGEAPHNRNYPYKKKTVAYYRADGVRHELFPFDPNTADSTMLLRLGLQPWQVRNIYKYRAKGGIYRKPGDFARLYGLTAGQYRRLEPYIRISADYLPAANLFKEEERNAARDTLKYPVKIKENEHLALNDADTTALKTVPGIGSGYARAIVNYRNRLGGYASVRQLLEIDGFPEESLKYFVIEGGVFKKININKLTTSQLRRHPYINYFQAKAIVDYRRLHGNIKSLDDLRLCRDFPPEAIARLRPYVEF